MQESNFYGVESKKYYAIKAVPFFWIKADAVKNQLGFYQENTCNTNDTHVLSIR